ncbi:tyrosine-type recombinase/integrase [Bosea beijingensis]
MAREVKKLSARSVATLAKVGRHSDGDGLYLIVDASGAKRWAFLFRWEGKLKEMGLGGTSAVSLADARNKAGEARRTLDSGANPIEERKRHERERSAAKTFSAFADPWMEDILKGFKNPRHRAQWTRSIKVYCAPIRDKRFNDISTDDILGILQPLWQTKQETASRLRGRIERVFDAAKAKGLRSGENPARWRGHLKELLSQRKKLQRGHHPAMPYQDAPSFLAKLRSRKALSARAFEFCILCASRSDEVLGARWSEFNFSSLVWTIPKARMKVDKDHRVPLSPRAAAILEEMKKVRVSDFVFPGQKPNRPLSAMAFEMLMRRMGVPEFTPHGFRSSFRDWAGDETNFPREVAEAALSHAVGDEAEQSYRREDALAKRRRLMEAWANYLGRTKTSSKVVALRASGE